MASKWSPCSRFIAVARDLFNEIAILDALTLEQLHTMDPCQKIVWTDLIFSPDGHLLTGYSYSEDCIVSWDLQTGGLISNISTVGQGDSMSYSGCGTVLGVLFRNTIMTYNTISGTHISSCSVPKYVVGNIWTYGECFQFATVDSGSITIWKVSFTSSHAPTEISSLPIPDNFSSSGFAFLPTHSQLAFVLQGRVLVWDAQHQKTLLDSEDVKDPTILSFSPDGCFFICGTRGQEFYLWKESPDGYLLHQKFVSSTRWVDPVVSPNGESIISSGGPMLQLWHTKNSTTSPPDISIQASQHAEDTLLELSSDGSLVAVAGWLSNTVTVLDVRSGNPLLVIDTNTKICGVRITESTIIIVGDGKIITWNLSAGDGVLNVRRNIGDSIQTTIFEHSEDIGNLHASISPDLNYIAFGSTRSSEEDLCLYDIHTGKKLAGTKTGGWLPGFTLVGHEVWCTAETGRVDRWTIVKDNESNFTRLEFLGESEKPLSGFPWHSSCGYQVTDDGWILNSNGKQLFWLPHHWRSEKAKRRWSGKFLVVPQSGLPEAIILELEV